MGDLVSIIMPSYNTAKYIRSTIESVFQQTYTNWELIIVDDCSSDDTDSIVQSLQDNRIKYLKNKENSGAAFSRNRALEIAKGRWIAFLDSDDLWFPNKLENQIRFMKENNYHFSYTNYSEIDPQGNEKGNVISGPWKIKKTGMFNYCWPGCLTVMYDRNSVGLITIKNIKKNNDYAMWLQVCKKENCYLLNEVLAKYRRGRAGSVSSNSVMTMIKWHYKLFREAEHQNIFCSIINTCRNLGFGLWKKIRYVKKVKRVCVIGHLGEGKNLLNGQTIKTKIITKELKKYYGEHNVGVFDTYGGVKAFLNAPILCYNALSECENIIIMPAENGLRVYAPMLSFINLIKHKNLYYVVIGGWLPDFIENKKLLSYVLKRFKKIYVETNSMVSDLKYKGFTNINVLPNCKEMEILRKKEIHYTKKPPYKLCTFSRVMKEKGIEIAVNAVTQINNIYGNNAFWLDIYGQIDSNQKQWFDELMKLKPDFIRYGGLVPFNKTTEVLKNYDALLFPTYYEGEGFAGTLIDAMAAGVPVIASDWKYNKEIVKEGKTGVLIKDEQELIQRLKWILENIDIWNNMKLSSINSASAYKPSNALATLFADLER